MDDFRGKVAVVTGAASGIGEALAVALAREGAHVALSDIAPMDRALAAVRAHGGRAIAVPADVASGDSVQALADAVYAEFGQVDVLCLNAGVVLMDSLVSTSLEDWDWILGVNVKGVINGVHHFLPRMIGQGTPGHVVVTASGAGLAAAGPLPLGAYATSKFAVMGFAEGLRVELEPKGIGVSILCPGSTATGILDSARYGAAAQHLKPAGTGAPTPSREGVRRMAPSETAELVLRGIRENWQYIITHPENRAGVDQRFRNIMAAFERRAFG